MFLKNLDKLMLERRINKSVLARESGVPYTTIDGFYKKGWDNVKLSTLLKLAAYFEISLDALVNGTEGGAPIVIQAQTAPAESYTAKEKAVVEAYRKDEAKREMIDKVIKGEALVPAKEEKPTETSPVRRKRKDDIIIF